MDGTRHSDIPINGEPVTSKFVMPDLADARPGVDLVALGADLSPGTLIDAYRSGLFPMPVDPSRRRSKIAWYSPDPRGILPLDGMHISRSLRRSRRGFDVTFNRAFRDVVLRCASPDREGRWITNEFVDAYVDLHEMEWAHSVEVWQRGELVGGLYGLRIDGLFAGESMFHSATDASKVALMELVDCLNESNATLLDVQWSTPHLASLGVVDVSRTEYLELLGRALEATPDSSTPDPSTQRG